jgi:hypothetical protein
VRLERSNLGAVYRLEFSMVELQHLQDTFKMEPPIQGQHLTSAVLMSLAATCFILENEVPQQGLRYQGDPDF